jgi:cysteinyl-tRNA synthetase
LQGDVTRGSDKADATRVVSISREWIQERIDAREAARKRKDFAEADRIRNELLSLGIVLEDTPQVTTWRQV